MIGFQSVRRRDKVNLSTGACLLEQSRTVRIVEWLDVVPVPNSPDAADDREIFDACRCSLSDYVHCPINSGLIARSVSLDLQ